MKLIVISNYKSLTPFSDGWNNWIWVPWVNDCHSDLENAFNQAGVPFSGAPNGRVDADDQLAGFIKRLERWVNSPSFFGY